MVVISEMNKQHTVISMIFLKTVATVWKYDYMFPYKSFGTQRRFNHEFNQLKFNQLSDNICIFCMFSYIEQVSWLWDNLYFLFSLQLDLLFWNFNLSSFFFFLAKKVPWPLYLSLIFFFFFFVWSIAKCQLV